MTDEHLMRQWADAHSDFSSDLDRGLLRLGRYLHRRLQRRQAIDKPYASPTPDVAMSAPARAALAGVLACVATAALLVTVASLASSGAIDPARLHTAMAVSSPIVAHVILA